MTSAGSMVDEQRKLTDYIIGQIEHRITGRAYPECTHNYPRDVYFVGNLRPEEVIQAHDAQPHLPELMTKLAPVALGVELKISPTEQTTISVSLSWSSYYRVLPSFSQQSAHQRDLTAATASPAPSTAKVTRTVATGEDEVDEDEPAVDKPADDETETSAARSRRATQTDVLMLRFKKIECVAKGDILITTTSTGSSADATSLSQAVEIEVARAHAMATQDGENFRHSGDPYTPVRVPTSALASEQAFAQFLTTLKVPAAPHWEWEIRCSTRPEPDDHSKTILNVLFTNRSSKQIGPNGKDHLGIEPFLFDTNATFEYPAGFVEPFVIELAPKGFRFDRFMTGRPFNCAVEVLGPTSLRTTHIPIFVQDRLSTRATPSATFVDLSSDPLPILDRIVSAMEDYGTEWTSAAATYRNSIPDWDERFSPEFARDRLRFDEEIASFRRGVGLIRQNSDILLAFKLTNETFRRSGERNGKVAWRLFQLVFLVSQIPGLASLASLPGSHPDDLARTDIIYFPTGGGKTEAYLSVLVFHCFFDRLRGKTAGVTSWIRFPLRLLTLQQTQRVADVLCVAELIRRSHSEPRLSGRSVSGFGVGYFVGKTSTPNELTNPAKYRWANAEVTATWATASNDTERQKWRRLLQCPSCGTPTIHIDLDEDRVRLLHRCTNSGCAFDGGLLPVYVVDNEIYRYLPSVLVGTIDKLASVGSQRKMAQVFGDVDGYCKTHGYYKRKCCQKDCDGKSLMARIPSGLSGPTLFLQDELHLLKEGLGTFDGHYETFTQQLLSSINAGARFKIIASSATIENFERQVEHLYAADPALARIFPGPGPTLASSFYASTLSYPQRLFVGLIPHNKTIFNAMLELLEHYHSVLQELAAMSAQQANPFGGNFQPSTNEWNALLDLYVTSLSYFLSSRDLNSIHTDLDGHVTPQLQSQHFSPLHILELTGSTSTDDVAATLEHLASAKPGREKATSVLATNMVSHGVDIDRLNAMFFYGMPRQNAEYIQASSRVGRSHVGIVFLCHHPARERDQSHYSLFTKYHEYLGQMVEPVAINRWATFSVKRTVPGLFMGILLQLFANRADPREANVYGKVETIKKLIANGTLRASDFIPFLENSYRVTQGSTKAQQAFRSEIHRHVQQFLDQIVQANPSKIWVSETLIPRPMTSLRDVDEQIPIELDRTGSQWAAVSSSGHGGKQ